MEDSENKNLANVNITFNGPNGSETKQVSVKFLLESIQVANHACGETSNFKKFEVKMG